MDALTLDQIRLLITVVDEGSFSKAAKKLNRAQSAATYGIRKLEAQVGLPLFDRTAYRPTLTDVGRTLLLRARRIAEETNTFRDTARSLASGLEAELTIVVDAMLPMAPVMEALRAFAGRFPTVPPRMHVQSLGATLDMVLDGTCTIGLLPLMFCDIAVLRFFPLLTVELLPVVAPDHPLAAIDGPIETHVLHKHVQLVLTDRTTLTAGRDYGVLSGRAWRLGDLGAKHSMLLAGLGWGNMPAHLVEADIAQGRLKLIRPVDFETRTAKMVMCGAYLADHRLGPAGQWMIEHLADSAVRNSSDASISGHPGDDGTHRRPGPRVKAAGSKAPPDIRAADGVESSAAAALLQPQARALSGRQKRPSASRPQNSGRGR